MYTSVIQKYNEVNFNKVVCSEAQKKEFDDPKDKTKKITYHTIPIHLEKENATTEFIVRLPVCRFYPLTDTSDSLAMIHDRTHPDHENIIKFFDDLHIAGANFLYKNRNRVNKGNIQDSTAAKVFLRHPIYIKRMEDGTPKGSGNSYFRLLKGSPVSNSSLFVGPDSRVYPVKKFQNYYLEGSPVILISNIFCGQSCSIRMNLVQLDILKIKKLNSSSIDASYCNQDPKVIDEFKRELEDKPEEEEEPSSTEADAERYIRELNEMGNSSALP